VEDGGVWVEFWGWGIKCKMGGV